MAHFLVAALGCFFGAIAGLSALAVTVILGSKIIVVVLSLVTRDQHLGDILSDFMTTDIGQLAIFGLAAVSAALFFLSRALL